MNHIELLIQTAGVTPHGRADRVTRHRHALPKAMRQQGHSLQEITPTRPPPERIAANFYAVFMGDSGGHARAAPRPKGLKVDCGRREHGYFIARPGKKARK